MSRPSRRLISVQQTASSVIDKVLLPTVELSVDLSCANDGQVLDVADDGVMLKWSLNWEEPAGGCRENNIYRVKFAMHLGDFEYKWKNGGRKPHRQRVLCAEAKSDGGICESEMESFEGRECTIPAQCLARGVARDVQPVNLTSAFPMRTICVSHQLAAQCLSRALCRRRRMVERPRRYGCRQRRRYLHCHH